MERLINDLLESCLGRMIDQHLDDITLADGTCRQNERKLGKLEERYMALESLSDDGRTLIDEYITCLMKADHRNTDLCYLVGVRDTIKVLCSLNLLKGMEERT